MLVVAVLVAAVVCGDDAHCGRKHCGCACCPVHCSYACHVTAVVACLLSSVTGVRSANAISEEEKNLPLGVISTMYCND